MLLRLQVTSLSLNMTTDLPGAETMRRQLSFSVTFSGRDHLDLETGEVFQSETYATVRKEVEPIDATLYVSQAQNNDDHQYNEMRYFEASEVRDDVEGHPSFIIFQLFLSPNDVETLLQNARGGLRPSSTTLELQHSIWDKASPIEYGLEPDGTGIKWKNRENRAVRIVGVSFHYDLIAPPPEGLENARNSPTAVATHLIEVNRKMDRLTILVGFIAVLILVYLLSRI